MSLFAFLSSWLNAVNGALGGGIQPDNNVDAMSSSMAYLNIGFFLSPCTLILFWCAPLERRYTTPGRDCNPRRPLVTRQIGAVISRSTGDKAKRVFTW